MAIPGTAAAGYLDAVLRPAWVRVDLDALAANVRLLSTRIAPARLGAVVKADAYGHGAVRVALALERLGTALLAVALVEEGVELRRAGVSAPILVLGPAQPGQLAVFRRHRLTPAIASLPQLALWRDFAAGVPEPQAVHLEIDTGMSRLGIPAEEVAEALAMVRRAPGLVLAGVMSHFGDADDPASARNGEQEERFAAALALLDEDERRDVTIHLANSAAALYRPASRFDLVRFGLSLYGLDPGGGDDGGRERSANGGGLTPVMSVATRVVQVRRIPAGRAVGYGSRWVAPGDSVVATIPVGYADGYAWTLHGRAAALVAGRRVPVIGAISMDLTVLDVSGLEVGEGDEVVLLGRQGDEEITTEELATAGGTIAHEVLTRFGQRLPRVYLAGGQVEAVVSRFLPGTQR
ncbi:MAG TPA: alanine racemase [Thermoanaerobaculia bacterium]|nr:alanine racemase [Thermoanaerobaculia bacterium]